MSKASAKQGTKNTVIIIPGSIHEEPPERLKEEPNLDLVQISSFEGNIESAVTFYITEINRLCFDNSRLGTQLRRSLEEKKELADMIASFEEISKEDSDEKKKRVRRCANEIERKYVCQVIGCEKSYGTEGSMGQHMKLKHPEIDYVMQNSSQDHKNKKDHNKDSDDFEDDSDQIL